MHSQVDQITTSHVETCWAVGNEHFNAKVGLSAELSNALQNFFFFHKFLVSILHRIKLKLYKNFIKHLKSDPHASKLEVI